ncbi:MAG TPA: preprotein translocase subunit SecG [Chloroflexota bacterium]|nr:preprotein translocase subunit SecG [Chloroflexota bacterium]
MQALVPYLNLAQILVSGLLIVLILLQTRGTGFAAGYSADTSIFRTRRGVERTLFQLTIAVGVAFLAVSILSVVVPRFQS